MSKKNVTHELLNKYLAGNCTPEEASLVESWYASLEAEGSDRAEKEFDQPRQWARLQAILRDVETEPTPLGSEPSRSLWTYFTRIAAAIVLLAGVWGGYQYWQQGHDSESVSALDGTNSDAIYFENTSRKIMVHTLPDGSEVWLSPQARLQYPKQFQADFRDVALEGEAFFEVTRDTLHPFRVSSGEVLTTVLGTSFNIKANAQSQQYEVSVVTGKVSVSAPDPTGRRQSVQLLPRQQAIINATNGQLAQKELPAGSGKATAWQPVSLTFQDATLGNVAGQLEKEFDLKIRLVNPKLANCRVKAIFDQQRLPEILNMLTLMVEASYEMKGDTILLDGVGCEK